MNTGLEIKVQLKIELMSWGLLMKVFGGSFLNKKLRHTKRDRFTKQSY